MKKKHLLIPFLNLMIWLLIFLFSCSTSSPNAIEVNNSNKPKSIKIEIGNYAVYTLVFKYDGDLIRRISVVAVEENEKLRPYDIKYTYDSQKRIVKIDNSRSTTELAYQKTKIIRREKNRESIYFVDSLNQILSVKNKNDLDNIQYQWKDGNLIGKVNTKYGGGKLKESIHTYSATFDEKENLISMNSNIPFFLDHFFSEQWLLSKNNISTLKLVDDFSVSQYDYNEPILEWTFKYDYLYNNEGFPSILTIKKSLVGSIESSITKLTFNY